MLHQFTRLSFSSSLLVAAVALVATSSISELAQAETTTLPSNQSEVTSVDKAIPSNPVQVRSQSTVSPASSTSTKSTDTAIVQKINQDVLAEPLTVDTTAQNVTSVSQLSDVKPTDWAFTALQSLVERYGCIAGYPDRSFRGKQATSRYEFAAGLNACLDKINEIISTGLADKVSKEDLATLKRLQEEFASELATLRGRVDALNAKVTKLEA
ncbi:MAG: iron uptake porin, partial [Pseudanabaena sp.]